MNLYQVQSIIGKRYNISKKKVEYKVKWVGYPESQATWEPKYNLQFVKDMINEYQNAHNIKKTCQEGSRQPSGTSLSIEDSSGLVGQSAFEDRNVKKQQQDSESEPYQSKSRRLQRQKHKIVTKSRRRQSRRSSRRVHNGSSEEKGKSKGMTTRNRKASQLASYSSARSEGYYHNPSQSFPSSSQQQAVDSLPEIIDLPSDSDVKEDSDFTILQLARKNDNLLYLVSQQQQKRWVSRTEVIREHPLALIAFYQKNIKFRPKEESNPRNL